MKEFKFYSIWLCMAILVAFLFQIFIPGFTDAFILNKNSLIHPWRFFTAIFLHNSLAHLLYNFFALFIFGFILERTIGSKKFIILFFISGLLVNLFSFYFYQISLGASGAIMTLIGCLAVLRPFMAVWSFGLILPMFFVAVAWAIGSILGIFGFGSPNVGYIAHLSGLFIGILCGIIIKIFNSENFLVVYRNTKKVKIPEEIIKSWEDFYIRK